MWVPPPGGGEKHTRYSRTQPADRLTGSHSADAVAPFIAGPLRTHILFPLAVTCVQVLMRCDGRSPSTTKKLQLASLSRMALMSSVSVHHSRHWSCLATELTLP